jgi:hypothetical protein
MKGMRALGLAILALGVLPRRRTDVAGPPPRPFPTAVRDLDPAAADFGFVIKPDRPHDDGIRNQHVRLPMGARSN